MVTRIFSLQEKVVKVSISLILVFGIFFFSSKTFDQIALLCGGITTLIGIHPFNSKLNSFEFFRLIGVIIGILGALFLFFLFFTMDVSLRYSVYLLPMVAFLLVISTSKFPEKIASNVSVITLVILTLHLDQANAAPFKTLTLRVVAVLLGVVIDLGVNAIFRSTQINLSATDPNVQSLLDERRNDRLITIVLIFLIYQLGKFGNINEMMLAIITAFLALRIEVKDSKTFSVYRLLGTGIGCLGGVVYYAVFYKATEMSNVYLRLVGLIICIYFVGMICASFVQSAMISAGMAAMIIICLAVPASDDWKYLLQRLSATLIGVCTAILVDQIRNHLSREEGQNRC